MEHSFNENVAAKWGTSIVIHTNCSVQFSTWKKFVSFCHLGNYSSDRIPLATAILMLAVEIQAGLVLHDLVLTRLENFEFMW
jgi:hypothetical protein